MQVTVSENDLASGSHGRSEISGGPLHEDITVNHNDSTSQK